MTMIRYEAHALAELFPLIEGREFDELVISIRDHGLREPITLYEGQILDGRNRYRACEAASVEPRFEEFTGDDPYAFVADMNLHRRHLTPGQLGMIGARMATMSVGNPKLQKTSIVGTPTIGISQEQAAKVLNVSRDTVLSAKLILDEGTPEEIQSVEQGKRGVGPLAQAIRDRNPRNRNDKGMTQPKNTAKVKDALKRGQINSKLWQELSGALISIGNLPKASDMATIARNISRSDTVDRNLANAIAWLTEFQIAWIATKKDAA